MTNLPHSLTTPVRFPLDWLMTSCERLALIRLLDTIRPTVSLEIGTYRGGSLQALAHFSRRVISVDTDPAVATNLAGRFANVGFRTGDSVDLLPCVIEELNAAADPLGFVLIDGDHSTEGVRRDINAVLRLRPRNRVVVIMHDSFNPDCRAGMRLAAWAECPYVHYVELDFVPGVFLHEAQGHAAARSMWAGFACAVLEAEPREGSLVIHESQRHLFDNTKLCSCHHVTRRHVALRRIRRTARRVKRALLGSAASEQAADTHPLHVRDDVSGAQQR